MSVCNFDCFNCCYSDCLSRENITSYEIEYIENEDTEISDERRHSENKKFNSYNHSIKGVKRLIKYEESEKGRNRDKKYKKSDKGKKSMKKAQKKRNDMEWLDRYERIYAGTSRNTDKRRWKAARIRQKYGIESCYKGRPKKSVI